MNNVTPADISINESMRDIRAANGKEGESYWHFKLQYDHVAGAKFSSNTRAYEMENNACL